MIETGNAKNITATTTIYTGSGQLLGIFVASTSAGTIKVTDGAATVVNTFSPAAATWYRLPFNFATSLVITVGGTLDATVAWLPNN